MAYKYEIVMTKWLIFIIVANWCIS